VKTRLLFLAIITPLGVLARPLWRRRLDLGFDPSAVSYWRDRRAERVTSKALRRVP
jgi:hypothetical protein